MTTSVMIDLEKARERGEALLASVEAVASAIPDGDDVAEMRTAAGALARVAREAVQGALWLVSQSMKAEEARAQLEGITAETLKLNDKLIDELSRANAATETAIAQIAPELAKKKH